MTSDNAARGARSRRLRSSSRPQKVTSGSSGEVQHPSLGFGGCQERTTDDIVSDIEHEGESSSSEEGRFSTAKLGRAAAQQQTLLSSVAPPDPGWNWRGLLFRGNREHHLQEAAPLVDLNMPHQQSVRHLLRVANQQALQTPFLIAANGSGVVLMWVAVSEVQAMVDSGDIQRADTVADLVLHIQLRQQRNQRHGHPTALRCMLGLLLLAMLACLLRQLVVLLFGPPDDELISNIVPLLEVAVPAWFALAAQAAMYPVMQEILEDIRETRSEFRFSFHGRLWELHVRSCFPISKLNEFYQEYGSVSNRQWAMQYGGIFYFDTGADGRIVWDPEERGVRDQDLTIHVPRSTTSTLLPHAIVNEVPRKRKFWRLLSDLYFDISLPSIDDFVLSIQTTFCRRRVRMAAADPFCADRLQCDTHISALPFRNQSELRKTAEYCALALLRHARAAGHRRVYGLLRIMKNFVEPMQFNLDRLASVKYLGRIHDLVDSIHEEFPKMQIRIERRLAAAVAATFTCVAMSDTRTLAGSTANMLPSRFPPLSSTTMTPSDAQLVVGDWIRRWEDRILGGVGSGAVWGVNTSEPGCSRGNLPVTSNSGGRVQKWFASWVGRPDKPVSASAGTPVSKPVSASAATPIIKPFGASCESPDGRGPFPFLKSMQYWNDSILWPEQSLRDSVLFAPFPDLHLYSYVPILGVCDRGIVGQAECDGDVYRRLSRAYCSGIPQCMYLVTAELPLESMVFGAAGLRILVRRLQIIEAWIDELEDRMAEIQRLIQQMAGVVSAWERRGGYGDWMRPWWNDDDPSDKAWWEFYW